MSTYTVVDEFFVEDPTKTIHVIVLDRDFDLDDHGKKTYVDGIEIKHFYNSILRWLLVETKEPLLGKEIQAV